MNFFLLSNKNNLYFSFFKKLFFSSQKKNLNLDLIWSVGFSFSFFLLLAFSWSRKWKPNQTKRNERNEWIGCKNGEKNQPQIPLFVSIDPSYLFYLFIHSFVFCFVVVDLSLNFLVHSVFQFFVFVFVFVCLFSVIVSTFRRRFTFFVHLFVGCWFWILILAKLFFFGNFSFCISILSTW